MSSELRAFAAGLVALTLSCDFNSSSFTPGISRTNPVGVTLADSQLEIEGARFAPGAMVFWNGHLLRTTFESTEQVLVQLDPSLLSVGTAQIQVQNPEGLISAPFGVPVVQPGLLITSLSPAGGPVGGSDFALTVNGFSFGRNSTVYWNRLPLATAFVSERTLRAQVPAGLIAVAGSGIIQVIDLTDSRITESNLVGFNIGPANVQAMSQGAPDLAWDAVHQMFFAVVGSSLAVIDPATAAIRSSLGYDMQSISVSSGSRFLYAGARAQLVRYDLPGLTNRTVFPLPSDQAAYAGLLKVAAAPGDDFTCAAGGTTYASGLFLFSNGQWTSKWAAPLGTWDPGFKAATWGADDSIIHAVYGNSVLPCAVDATGLACQDPRAPSAFPSVQNDSIGIHFEPSNGYLYSDDRSTISPDGRQEHPFPTVSDWSCVVTTDGSVGKIFFACRHDSFVTERSLIVVESYDLATNHSLGMLSLGIGDMPNKIIRWGSDGLAVTTPTSLLLYQGGFVR